MHSTHTPRLRRWLTALVVALYFPALAQAGNIILLAVDNNGNGGEPSANWRSDVQQSAPYAGWVELKLADFSLSRYVTSAPNQLPTFSTAAFSELGVIKVVDRTSPRTFLTVASQSAAIPFVEIHYLTEGVSARVFLKLKLEGVYFSSVSSAATGGEDKLDEKISVYFRKMTVTYIPETGTQVTGSYDQVP